MTSQTQFKAEAWSLTLSKQQNSDFAKSDYTCLQDYVREIIKLKSLMATKTITYDIMRVIYYYEFCSMMSF